MSYTWTSAMNFYISQTWCVLHLNFLNRPPLHLSYILVVLSCLNHWHLFLQKAAMIFFVWRIYNDWQRMSRVHRLLVTLWHVYIIVSCTEFTQLGLTDSVMKIAFGLKAHAMSLCCHFLFNNVGRLESFLLLLKHIS